MSAVPPNAAANAQAAALASHTQAVDLIQQAAAILAAIPGRSPESQALQPAITLIEQAIPIVQGVRDAGDSGLLRWRIYQVLQAQKNDGDSAIYKELRCSICMDLAGVNGPPATIGCGHTYCRGCIGPVIAGPVPGRRCPDCRVSIVAGSPLVTNVAIKGIVDRLLPRAAPGGKRSKRKTQKNRTR
jgi:hypothetical protein